MMEHLGTPYRALLLVLNGLAEGGVVDRNTVGLIGRNLAQAGNEMMAHGYQVDGAELLRLADATAPIHDRLRDRENATG